MDVQNNKGKLKSTTATGTCKDILELFSITSYLGAVSGWQNKLLPITIEMDMDLAIKI